MSALKKATNALPVFLIRFYRRFISPLFPPTCRFHPSCSAYGLKAFQHHNLFRAMLLTSWRILRCNPFNPGGYDPVPGCEDDDDELSDEEKENDQ